MDLTPCFSILILQRNPCALPPLPASALPADTDADVVDITANGSDFLQGFLDPVQAGRKKHNTIQTPTLI